MLSIVLFLNIDIDISKCFNVSIALYKGEFMRKILCVLFISLLPSIALADITVGSFNIKHWGWDNGKDQAKVAEIIRRFDIVAVQEVMKDKPVKEMVSILNKNTNKNWKYMTSDAVGRNSYQEQYAFIWNDNVSYDRGQVLYIDDKDIYAREPMSAKFISNKTGREFALATIHITFGDSISDRKDEIRSLSHYWDWLGEVYPNTPRILSGDFNLWYSHNYFDPLLSKSEEAITQGATTLSPKNGKYANLYDNFYYEPSLNVTSAGIFPFPQKFGITHKEARDSVSDHAPIYMTIGNSTFDDSKLQGVIQDVEVIGMSCIDINKSGKDDLANLPRIGEARAEDIIKGRPWKSIESLAKIRGIGIKTTQKIAKHPDLCD